MKKIAIVLYPNYCLFEITTFLEAAIIRKSDVKIETFAETLDEFRSEEGILIRADKLLSELNPHNFDALVLSGFSGDFYPIKDDALLIDLIRAFDKSHKVIGAISIAPVFLFKAGVLENKEFMCGCMKEDLLEEGYSYNQLKLMKDWNFCCENYDTLKYIISDNIITSVAYGYREWAIELCKLLNIETSPKSFGLVY